MARKMFTILFGLVISTYCHFAFAVTQQAIGMVIFVQGKAIARDQANRERVLQRRLPIYLQDRIITDKDSKLQLRLEDDSMIIMQPSSEYFISEFSYKKGAREKTKYVGNIVKGMLLNISGQGEEKNYQLNSPLATIAFRGTSLETKILSRGNIPIDQKIHVSKGYVTVSNICGKVGNSMSGASSCEPTQIDVGVGQRVNSASINRGGAIQGFNGASLFEANNVITKALVKQEGGAVAVRCR